MASVSTKPLQQHLKPLLPLLEGEGVFEVCINREKEVWIETREGWRREEVEELSGEHLLRLAKLISTFSGQRLDLSHPILSATLPDGQRIQIITPPACPYVSLTIRKPNENAFTLEDYEKAGAFSKIRAKGESLQDDGLRALLDKRDIVAFLKEAVRKKKNILVSGSTGSGKTTLMKALMGEVPREERLISIENVDELGLARTHPNSVSLFYSAGGQGRAAITQQHLLESSLRMRPDRIFLAELIRGDEAFYYLRNVNSGHPGSITSMHANSAELAKEQLVLFLKESVSGRSLTRAEIKHLISLCIHIIVQIKNIKGERRVTEIDFPREEERC